MHRAGGIRELVTDPARFLEHFGLDGGELGERVSRSLARHARGHRRFLDIGRLAKGTFDEARPTLLLEIGIRAEPGFERLAAVAALEIEHDHKVTASGIGRRWFSAGMRDRTSEMRLRSMSAKPTPRSSPMSRIISPQGSTTREWPKV